MTVHMEARSGPILVEIQSPDCIYFLFDMHILFFYFVSSLIVLKLKFVWYLGFIRRCGQCSQLDGTCHGEDCCFKLRIGCM